jgi:hypothetical protein
MKGQKVILQLLELFFEGIDQKSLKIWLSYMLNNTKKFFFK